MKMQRCFGITVGFAALLAPALALATSTARFYYADIASGYIGADIRGGAISPAAMVTGTESTPGQPNVRNPFITQVASNSITYINTLGFHSATTSAMNLANQIAGVGVTSSGVQSVYRYTPGVGMENLGALGGPAGFVADINSVGEVVGTWQTAGGPNPLPQAFVYSAATGMLALGDFGGGVSEAVAISDAGRVIGTASVGGPAPYTRAYVWQSGVMTPIGPEGVDSFAVDINESGLIIGRYTDAEFNPQGFVYQVGAGMIDLPLPQGATGWTPTDLSETGVIVGTIDGGPGVAGGFIYRPGQGFEMLVPPAGYSGVKPSHVNAAGNVVGMMLSSQLVPRAFYYSSAIGTVMLDSVIVPPLRYPITEVIDLNDRDDVLINGLYLGRTVSSVIFPTRKGDMNCDDFTDLEDIDGFVLALSGRTVYDAMVPNCNWPSADINDDGVVNFADIDGFIALLAP